MGGGQLARSPIACYTDVNDILIGLVVRRTIWKPKIRTCKAYSCISPRGDSQTHPFDDSTLCYTFCYNKFTIDGRICIETAGASIPTTWHWASDPGGCHRVSSAFAPLPLGKGGWQNGHLTHLHNYDWTWIASIRRLGRYLPCPESGRRLWLR